MRVLLFGNGWVACEIARCLREAGDEIVGLVRHPAARARWGNELLQAAALAPELTVDGSQLRASDATERIHAFSAEMGLSAYFGYMLPPQILALLPRGVVNVHPGLLPFNRGAYPNVWSILDRTPAGVTLHWMDAGLDTGPIIAQRRVPVEAVDTGATLYRKLETAAVELFRDSWPGIRAGTSVSSAQSDGGTVHRAKDVAAVDRIDLDRTYTARDLIDLIRARTFPPHRGAYFEDSGRRIYLRLELMPEESEATDLPRGSMQPATSGERP